jgi:hypothetical protein
MGEKALVESQVADAMMLIRELDSRGASPALAAWYFYDDADEWRLLLAGEAFDDLLGKQEAVAYRKVVEAMSSLSLSSLSLSDIKLLPSRSPLAGALRMLIRTPPNGLMRAHFTDTSLNGIFIKEMIILRSALDRAA